MSYYADSSFLVSCYIPDANTPRATAHLQRITAPIAFTALHVLEVRNAFELGVFRGLFAASAAVLASANLAQDLRSGRLAKMPVNWPLALRVASGLSRRHSAVVGTRSMDILHVAAAKSLRAKDFLSFDARQRTLAAALGMRVAP